MAIYTEEQRAQTVAPSAPLAAADYFAQNDVDKAFSLLQVIGEDGSVLDQVTANELEKDQALLLYRGMRQVRITDTRMMALQRQGRIGFYGEALGQEAAVIGSASVLGADDWIVPALREAGVGLFHGLPLESYISQIFGNGADVSKGRQMPCHPCDRNTNYVVMSSCVSSQIPHAVGIAWAMKLMKHTGRCCFGYMGDGGTSEGDFHVAMNFAGTSKAPVVLICQNNQWAISTPGAIQTAAETIASKGLAYGVESLRVDGNDLFAVRAASKYAADKAKRGDGATFIELLTYRVSAHSSSDDPSRYRDETVTNEWKARRDPIERTRRYLMEKGWLTESADTLLAEEIEAKVREIIAQQEAVPPPKLDTLIEDVFEEPHWRLKEQLAAHKP